VKIRKSNSLNINC